ncbi:hypothetical protein GF312_16500 [Candidatus Poribacteria bacterium]|nr:hypothetical protein [Candidatus Poribacteria bacterium]
MKYSYFILVMVAISLLFLGNSLDASMECLSYNFEFIKDITDHDKSVNSISLSPDGRFLASGSSDNNAKLWDIESGKGIRPILRHPHAVKYICFSPDSNILATGTDDGAITLWDVNYKERLRILKGHESAVLTLGFKPDGSLLFSGSEDKNIRLWDMKSGKEISIIKNNLGIINSMDFSRDGSMMAFAGSNGIVKIWDVESGKEILEQKIGDAPVNSLCFRYDGNFLALGMDNGVIHILDIKNNQKSKELIGHQDAIGQGDCISINPDGRIMASGSRDGEVIIWDFVSGSVIKKIDNNDSSIESVIFNHDGTKMLYSDAKGVIRIWNVKVTESLEITLKTGYDGWQRGKIDLNADVLGRAEFVKFQYSLDDFKWVDITKMEKAPYNITWNTKESIPGVADYVRIRAVAEGKTGITALDLDSKSFSIDNKFPITNHNYDGQWHNKNFFIKLSAEDEGSGLLLTKYRINYGEEKSTKWNGEPEITFEGENTLEYWSIDKIGNEEAHKVLTGIGLDKTTPAFIHWSKNPENIDDKFTGPLRINVQILDEGGSGLDDESIKIDYHVSKNSSYKGYKNMPKDESGTWYYDISEPLEGWSAYNGDFVFYKIRCSDNAGNVLDSPERQEFIGGSSVPPVVKLTTALKEWERGTLTLSAEAVDTDGSIEKVIFEYSFDGVIWNVIGTDNEIPYSIQWDTTSYIKDIKEEVFLRTSAVDNDDFSAKHISDKFGIDNEAPVTNHNYDGGWYKKNFTITLTSNDSEGGGVAKIFYKINDGREQNVTEDGQPEITEQGKSILEYWSIDVAGNEEKHKILSDIKLDRLAPFVEEWKAENKDNIIKIQVKIVDTESGITLAPQFDYHIGSGSDFAGYKEMRRSEDKSWWSYNVDILGQNRSLAGKTIYCKLSVKDVVGNLSIDMWEYSIPGNIEASNIDRDIEIPDESDIRNIDMDEIMAETDDTYLSGEGRIEWLNTPENKVELGDEIELQGTMEPDINQAVPVKITVITPEDKTYVSLVDTSDKGIFSFRLPINSEGKWVVAAEWEGNSEFSRYVSSPIEFVVGTEDAKFLSDTKTGQKAANFLKKNTIIIGLVVLYVIIIRLYKN